MEEDYINEQVKLLITYNKLTWVSHNKRNVRVSSGRLSEMPGPKQLEHNFLEKGKSNEEVRK
jgi:hypothetical protein